jgi:hypothetical protein
MRVQFVIFPHPLDVWLRFFALLPAGEENPPGVGKILLFAPCRPPAARAKYLTKQH